MHLRFKISELELNSEVAQCSPDTGIEEVLRILQGNQIGSVVITEDERVVGIFTERDYLMKVAGKIEDFHMPISSLMSKDPKCVQLSNNITDVLEMMQAGGFRHVIVVDERQRVKAMISVKDLMNFLITSIHELEENLKDLVACVA